MMQMLSQCLAVLFNIRNNQQYVQELSEIVI